MDWHRSFSFPFNESRGEPGRIDYDKTWTVCPTYSEMERQSRSVKRKVLAARRIFVLVPFYRGD